MNSHNPFESLAALFGIELEYTDIWGNRHVVPEKTLLTLLRAMGVDIDNPDTAEAVLEDETFRLWRNRLDPVSVAGETERPIAVTLRIPRAEEQRQFTWFLDEENGSRHEGHFRPIDLERLESRGFHGAIIDRYALFLPLMPGYGYHRFILAGSDKENPHRERATIILTPTRCYLPPLLAEGGRTWGVAAQLYGLASGRNWGIGDFTDLASLVKWCAERGGGIIGVNPLHGLFPHNPSHASPYSPSSRQLLNLLYLDIEAIPDFAECGEVCDLVSTPPFQSRLEGVRRNNLVDYREVTDIKLTILDMLYRSFHRNHLLQETERGRDFQRFIAHGGEPMKRFALFEALQEHFFEKDKATWGWPVWPAPYRNPESREVKEFEERHRERVEFYLYLQWEADRQLHQVGLCCLGNHLPVGLYLDLAVSIDRGGAEAWAYQDIYALDMSIGAPPDDFNLNGQNWGLPPIIPHRLRQRGYTPFIETLRHSMRHAGAIRIDHIMALMRLFCIPPDTPGSEGAYIHFHFEELLGIVALESVKNRCLVIGEDLGTVPDAVREGMARRGILSYKLFYFEKEWEGDFRGPRDYPTDALVSVSTHDLPTLRGYWEGTDLSLRREMNLYPSEEAYNNQLSSRLRDRGLLLTALEREGLLPAGVTTDPASAPEMTVGLSTAVHTYLARTPCSIQMVQLEELLNQREQANIPGTTNQHPNWRRKLNIEELNESPYSRAIGEALTHEREKG
ncbi:MAG: 4-alpha-glucanotransferase [Thermodesulfobacteriota bacterium]